MLTTPRPLASGMLLLAGLFLMGTATAWAEIRWLESVPGYTRAFNENKQSGKPFLVYFTSRMCGWCKRLEGSLLSDPTVIQALSKFNCVRIMMSDREADYNMAQRFQINGTPTMYFYSGSPPRKRVIYWQIQGGAPASAQMFLSQF